MCVALDDGGELVEKPADGEAFVSREAVGDVLDVARERQDMTEQLLGRVRRDVHLEPPAIGLVGLVHDATALGEAVEERSDRAGREFGPAGERRQTGAADPQLARERAVEVHQGGVEPADGFAEIARWRARAGRTSCLRSLWSVVRRSFHPLTARSSLMIEKLNRRQGTRWARARQLRRYGFCQTSE